MSPIYISPICNVEIYYYEKIKIRNSLFFSLHMVSEPRLSTSLGPPGETGLSLLRPKARCVRGRLLGYPTSVVEGVGDEFISVRESLIS